jgi:hypothetical protein
VDRGSHDEEREDPAPIPETLQSRPPILFSRMEESRKLGGSRGEEGDRAVDVDFMSRRGRSTYQADQFGHEPKDTMAQPSSLASSPDSLTPASTLPSLLTSASPPLPRSH